MNKPTVSQLRAAFLDAMKTTLLDWAQSHAIYHMDGEFTSRQGWDGRTIHVFAKKVYHFTPQQWVSEEVQAQVERLTNLATCIRAEKPKKRNTDFMMPVVLEGVSRMSVSLSKGHSSQSYSRLDVLENLISRRDSATDESLKMRYAEMVGAVRAIRDPVLRGRRATRQWAVYYHQSDDSHLEEINRVKYGVVVVSEKPPSVMEVPYRKSRKSSYYDTPPIAAYLDPDVETPIEFWPEKPELLDKPDFGNAV